MNTQDVGPRGSPVHNLYLTGTSAKGHAAQRLSCLTEASVFDMARARESSGVRRSRQKPAVHAPRELKPAMKEEEEK